MQAEPISLTDEIRDLLSGKSNGRVYSDTAESIPYAHSMLEGLRTAVLRLADEIQTLETAGRQNRLREAANGRRNDPRDRPSED